VILSGEIGGWRLDCGACATPWTARFFFEDLSSFGSPRLEKRVDCLWGRDRSMQPYVTENSSCTGWILEIFGSKDAHTEGAAWKEN
jgi:hypothetical protein